MIKNNICYTRINLKLFKQMLCTIVGTKIYKSIDSTYILLYYYKFRKFNNILILAIDSGE